MSKKIFLFSKSHIYRSKKINMLTNKFKSISLLTKRSLSILKKSFKNIKLIKQISKTGVVFVLQSKSLLMCNRPTVNSILTSRLVLKGKCTIQWTITSRLRYINNLKTRKFVDWITPICFKISRRKTKNQLTNKDSKKCKVFKLSKSNNKI